MSEADGLFEQAARALRGTDGKRDLAAARDLFRNTGPDGRRDPDAAHAGLPVAAGQKWIASRWIRERSFELPVDRAG